MKKLTEQELLKINGGVGETYCPYGNCPQPVKPICYENPKPQPKNQWIPGC